MSKTLYETFKPLNGLKINYSVSDISTEYLKIASEIELDDYLDYSSERSEDGIFHVILSVKVSNESSCFVPFFSIYNDHKDEIKRIDVFKSGRDTITYDFSQFLLSLRDFNNNKEVPCFSLEVDYSDNNSDNGIKIQDYKYLSQYGKANWLFAFFDDNDVSKKELKTKQKEEGEENFTNYLDKVLKPFGEVILPSGVKKDKKSFAQFFSDYYKNKGYTKLWFTFYNMDSDCNESPEYLTRLMIISSNRGEVRSFMNTRFGKIREIVSFIRSRYSSDLLKKNRYESIKAVVSAIMSRNMSHNLGSHYLTNTKNYFRNQVDRIIATQHQLSKEIATDYRGNARLLQYVQERMDFIATIISGDQYPLGGLNFKAEFFDILTNDDCGARHTSSRADKNEKNFLLQYLLYSEHLTRKYAFVEDNSDFREVELRVNYDGEVYTGKSGKNSNNEEIKDKEQDIKNKRNYLL